MKPTIKLSIKQHKFNSNNDECKKIKKEVKARLDYSISLPEIRNICNTFFGSYCQDKLINEGEFVFLSKVGKLNVFRERIVDNVKIMQLVKAGKINLGHNRANYHYPIVYTRGDGVAKEIKFVASKKVKEKLNNILNTTTKEYKPKLITTI